MGVLDVQLGRLDVSLIELDRALVLLDHERLVGRLLFGDRILGLQLLVAREIGPGFSEERLVMLELRLRLIERGLVGSGIDEKQRIARFDSLTLIEKSLHDLAVHPRLHVDGLDRLHRSERPDDDGDVRPDNGCRCHRNRRLNPRRSRRGGFGPAPRIAGCSERGRRYERKEKRQSGSKTHVLTRLQKRRALRDAHALPAAVRRSPLRFLPRRHLWRSRWNPSFAAQIHPDALIYKP